MINLDSVYFQQADGTCAMEHKQKKLLIFYGQKKYPDRVIFRRGDHNYPPRSFDLTPCTFFLYCHVKDKIIDNSPASDEDLKDGIRKAKGIGQ